jgi:hypothetical protein
MAERRVLTDQERGLVRRGLSSLKMKVSPGDPDWEAINRLWDAIIAGEV